MIRREIIGTGTDEGGHAVGLIDGTARYLLGRGFDVILEGILNADWYTESLLQLTDDHVGISRSYLYDLSLEETVRRHASKPVAAAFGPDELRKWWRGLQPIVGLDETVLTAADSLDATVARILDECWGSDPAR